MVTPRSVRLSDEVLRRLGDEARRRGASVSSTIELLLDEALRREAHPTVVFRDGPSGRRAGLVGGPDVDEVIATLRSVHRDESSDDAAGAVAEAMSLTPAQVRAAVAYYAEHAAEIDDRVTANARAADDLEAAWRRQQEILAGTSQ